jgi:hypothetical protein
MCLQENSGITYVKKSFFRGKTASPTGNESKMDGLKSKKLLNFELSIKRLVTVSQKWNKDKTRPFARSNQTISQDLQSTVKRLAVFPSSAGMSSFFTV